MSAQLKQKEKKNSSQQNLKGETRSQTKIQDQQLLGNFFLKRKKNHLFKQYVNFIFSYKQNKHT